MDKTHITRLPIMVKSFLKRTPLPQPPPTILRTVLIAILIASALVRLSWVMYIGLGAPPQRDDYEYHHLALSLTQGEGYQVDERPYFHRAPGYVLFLTPFYALAPYVETGQFINIALGIVAVFLAYLLARRCFGPLVGLISAGICAIYPLLIKYCPLILSENLIVPLNLTLVLLLLAPFNSGGKRALTYSMFAGFILALAILTRPMMLSALLFLPLSILLAGRGFKYTIIHSFLITTVAVACLVPWTLYNHHRTGHWIPIVTNSGRLLAASNNPKILEEDNPFKKYDIYFPDEILSAEQKAELTNAPPWVEDEALQKAILNYLSEHPRLIPRLLGKKIVDLFDPWPENHPRIFRLVHLFSFAPVMLLALWGLVLWAFRGPRKYLLMLAVALPTIFSALIFWAGSRFRLPMEPFIIILASLGVAIILPLLHKRRAANHTD